DRQPRSTVTAAVVRPARSSSWRALHHCPWWTAVGAHHRGECRRASDGADHGGGDVLRTRAGRLNDSAAVEGRDAPAAGGRAAAVARRLRHGSSPAAEPRAPRRTGWTNLTHAGHLGTIGMSPGPARRQGLACLLRTTIAQDDHSSVLRRVETPG